MQSQGVIYCIRFFPGTLGGIYTTRCIVAYMYGSGNFANQFKLATCRDVWGGGWGGSRVEVPPLCPTLTSHHPNFKNHLIHALSTYCIANRQLYTTEGSGAAAEGQGVILMERITVAGGTSPGPMQCGRANRSEVLGERRDRKGRSRER